MRYEIIPRTLIISIFAFSAIGKLNDIETVYLHIDEVMPFIKINALIEIVSFYIPLLELTLCLALLTRHTRKISYIISISLSLAFLIFVLLLEVDANCGCFGSALKLTHTQSIILDISLISFASLGLFLSRKSSKEA